jgi:hypothetical protein
MKPEEFASRMAEAASAFRPATELIRLMTGIAEKSVKREIRGGKNKAYDTGELYRSVHKRAEGRLVADAPHAALVHDGTKYMEARPYMDSGIAAAMPEIERELKEFGDSVFGKVGGR